MLSQKQYFSEGSNSDVMVEKLELEVVLRENQEKRNKDA